jgi:hypothetical protein
MDVLRLAVRERDDDHAGCGIIASAVGISHFYRHVGVRVWVGSVQSYAELPILE